MNITPVYYTKAGAGLASRLRSSLALALALALSCQAGLLLSCARAAGLPAEGIWLEGELTAAGSPVRFEIEGLVIGAPYRIAVYDRYRPLGARRKRFHQDRAHAAGLAQRGGLRGYP